MDWESSDVIRIDLWSLLQGQTIVTNDGYKFALVLRCVGLVCVEKCSIYFCFTCCFTLYIKTGYKYSIIWMKELRNNKTFFPS